MLAFLLILPWTSVMFPRFFPEVGLCFVLRTVSFLPSLSVSKKKLTVRLSAMKEEEGSFL